MLHREEFVFHRLIVASGFALALIGCGVPMPDVIPSGFCQWDYWETVTVPNDGTCWVATVDEHTRVRLPSDDATCDDWTTELYLAPGDTFETAADVTSPTDSEVDLMPCE